MKKLKATWAKVVAFLKKPFWLDQPMWVWLSGGIVVLLIIGFFFFFKKKAW